MKNLFVLFVILCTLSGCFTVPRPTTSTITYGHLSETEAPPSEETPKIKEPKRDGLPSGPVAVLLGLGGVLLLMSMTAMTIEEDNPGHPYFTVITGGTGLILWGAAGIVAATED